MEIEEFGRSEPSRSRRLAAAKPIVPNGPHPCVVKGGLLMRVSTPYHKNGYLMLGTFPGMEPRRTHTVVKDSSRYPTWD